MSKVELALMATLATLAGGGALKQSLETAPIPPAEPAKAEAPKPDLTEIGIGLGALALVAGVGFGTAERRYRREGQN